MEKKSSVLLYKGKTLEKNAVSEANISSEKNILRAINHEDSNHNLASS